MKEKINNLVNEKISKLNLYLEDAFIEELEGKKILNIVLDSTNIIDLKLITDASRMINKILDKEENILIDIDEVDIYSKEKGE